MEQVVKSGEIVLEIPQLLIKSGGHNLKSTEFCKNGITGKIEFSQTVYDFPLQCQAGFLTKKDDFYTFNFHVQVFVCQGNKDPVILASESALIPGNPDHSVSEIQMKLSRSGLLFLNYDKLRVVLNVDAVKHPKPPFLKQFQSGENSNVQLICEDEIFPVHTLILRTVSPVFRTMLEESMKKAGTGRIVIKDLNADTVKNMVDYIYHGRMNIGSDAQIIERFNAAEKYKLDSFKTACLERMVTSMSDENITSFLEMSVRLHAGNEFIKQMVDYCMDRIKELRKREDFLAFSRANAGVFLENLQTN